MLDDDHASTTTAAQLQLEKKVLPFYQELEHLSEEEIKEDFTLLREAHTAYLHKGLGQLSPGFAALDASRPWIVYWILHSLALLEAKLPETPTADEIVSFLSCCQSPSGGYGGGPMQLPHLAPTYAAVCALVTLGSEAALASINRARMFEFLTRMCVPPEQGGGFRVHEGGESDLRACYIAMAVAHMLSLDKQELAQRAGLAQYVRRCQTYEGGLGGEPGNEAHGGYTYCGLAAVTLANVAAEALDIPALVRWAAQRQGAGEGGFNGRTNKLVDGCYSFWQGCLFSMLQRLWPTPTGANGGPGEGNLGTAGAACPGPGSAEAAGAGAARAQGLAGPADMQLDTEAEVSSDDDGDDADGDDGEGQLPDVPPLPPSVMQARTPSEQATFVMQTRTASAQKVVSDALAAGEVVDQSMRAGTTTRGVQAQTAAARELLNQANTAQELVERAHYDMSMAMHGAASLYPVPDPLDPPAPTVAGPGGAALPNPPLYNHKALQLWILRCCQQSKGGLRDKPGKQPDFYHTCYCLSGLSQSQHTSNFVLGPRENLLRRADMLCNVADDKLMAALHFFRRRQVPGSAQLPAG